MFLDRLFLSSLVLAVPLGDVLHEKGPSALLHPPVGEVAGFNTVYMRLSKILNPELNTRQQHQGFLSGHLSMYCPRYNQCF